MLMIKLVDARKGLYEKCVELFHNEKVAESIYMHLCDGIEECDAVEPERKKGEWIDYTEDGYVECPYCHSATNCDGNKDELHYCYSCGAELR